MIFVDCYNNEAPSCDVPCQDGCCERRGAREAGVLRRGSAGALRVLAPRKQCHPPHGGIHLQVRDPWVKTLRAV